MFRTVRSRLGLAVFVVMPLCGCGGAAQVSGEVTYEGQAVEQGAISFVPADGKGPTAGAVIEKGRYTAANVPPGPKVVRIEAGASSSDRKTSEERARDAASGSPSGASTRLIPPGAKGNDAKVDVKGGDQTLDFHLTKPTR